MNKVRILNVKDGNTSPEYAMHLTDQMVFDCKQLGEFAFVVIHGYGSSGKGGTIKASVQEHLQCLKKHKKIVDFVPGEMWSDSNQKVVTLQRLCPDLILSDQVKGNNSGITVVQVAK